MQNWCKIPQYNDNIILSHRSNALIQQWRELFCNSFGISSLCNKIIFPHLIREMRCQLPFARSSDERMQLLTKPLFFVENPSLFVDKTFLFCWQNLSFLLTIPLFFVDKTSNFCWLNLSFFVEKTSLFCWQNFSFCWHNLSPICFVFHRLLAP